MVVGSLLSLLVVGWAHAESELVVQTDRPVIVVVNMRPYPTDGGTQRIPFTRGQAGVQNVRIRNLLGEQQWKGSVDLADGQQVTLLWADKGMTVGEPQPIEVPAKSTTRVEAADPDPSAVASPDPVVPRPVVRPARDESARVDPFVAAATEGSVSGRGAVEGVPQDATEPVGVGLGGVQFRNRTETWTNVVVDGQVHEVRGQPVVTLELAAGPHTVAFRDFQDRGTWWIGEVMVRADAVVEVQFSKASPPASPRDPGAWRAGP